MLSWSSLRMRLISFSSASMILGASGEPDGPSTISLAAISSPVCVCNARYTRPKAPLPTSSPLRHRMWPENLGFDSRMLPSNRRRSEALKYPSWSTSTSVLRLPLLPPTIAGSTSTVDGDSTPLSIALPSISVNMTLSGRCQFIPPPSPLESDRPLPTPEGAEEPSSLLLPPALLTPPLPPPTPRPPAPAAAAPSPEEEAP
mmetsp:Transcript_26518/g.92201  ORF Transcript_26518/g.92201 Transcript_26518/m.92201 type:complete len:201 (+) Transcript_26518:546-1148(+)